MTLKEFVKKYKDKFIDYDGYFGAQCMDLMHQYIDDVLVGKHSPEVLRAPCAKDAYVNFNRPDLFSKIDNTPQGIPQEGDIIFWGGGKYGHVAIFLRGNVDDFYSFDQNYPVGSNCHEQYHNYYNVIGWLRYKGGSMSLRDTQIDWYDFEGKSHAVGWYVHEWEVEKKNADKLSEEIAKKNEDYERLQRTVSEQNMQVATLQRQYQDTISEKNALETKLEALEDDFKGLAEDAEAYEQSMGERLALKDEEIEKLNKKITKLQKEVGEVNKDLIAKLWESVKVPLRMAILAIIPVIAAYLKALPQEWAAVLWMLFMALDKFLHELWKDKTITIAGREFNPKGISPV